MLQLSPSTEQRAGPTAGTLVTVTDTEATATAAAATWSTAAQLVTAIAAAAAATAAAVGSRTNHHCVCVDGSALHTLPPVALPALSVEAGAAHHCSTL